MLVVDLMVNLKFSAVVDGLEEKYHRSNIRRYSWEIINHLKTLCITHQTDRFFLAGHKQITDSYDRSNVLVSSVGTYDGLPEPIFLRFKTIRAHPENKRFPRQKRIFVYP